MFEGVPDWVKCALWHPAFLWLIIIVLVYYTFHFYRQLYKYKNGEIMTNAFSDALKTNNNPNMQWELNEYGYYKPVDLNSEKARKEIMEKKISRDAFKDVF
jgi:hypothetical protein